VRPGVIELLYLALLPFQQFAVDGPTVDSWWRSGLEPRHFQAGMLELFGEMNG
jgi:hypothetical protein